jgi:hypothetical protein
MLPNIALKIAPFGRLDAPQAARHLVQRYQARTLAGLVAKQLPARSRTRHHQLPIRVYHRNGLFRVSSTFLLLPDASFDRTLSLP